MLWGALVESAYRMALTPFFFLSSQSCNERETPSMDMKKFLALILLAFVPSAGAAAQATDSLRRQDVSIRKSHVIRSAVLAKEPQIQIALPEGYEGSDKTYPVVDILDWQWQFSHSVSFSTRLMATETIPEVILVGSGRSRYRSRHTIIEGSSEKRSAPS